MKKNYILGVAAIALFNSCHYDANDPLEGKTVEIKRKMIMQKISESNKYYLFDSSKEHPINDGVMSESNNRFYLYRGEKLTIVDVNKTCFDARGWITVTKGYYIDHESGKCFFSYEQSHNLETPW